jgi:phosphate transport system substrate-binding protein
MYARGGVLVTAALAFGLVVAACRQPADGGASQRRDRALPGTITVDGSSTVLPISRLLAADFQQANPAVKIEVIESATATGFEKLCDGAVDLIGASRPINAAELRRCESNSVAFIELPIAFDSLSVVVNAKNTFADCLSVAELKRMWEPAAQGNITRWNQIRRSFPAQQLTLVGPDRASGTFDYFTLAIVGQAGESRDDYTRSDNDQEIVDAIAADPNALGYFGYAHYLANSGTLKAVAIDSGRGCINPSGETVADATYQPLSRPVFVYVMADALTQPEVKAFARTYIDPANASRVRKVGYVPLPTATLLVVNRRLESSVSGSMFEGRGSVLGLTAEIFEDPDRVKNALVR